jgi:ABC-type transport system substrate-binding protein
MGGHGWVADFDDPSDFFEPLFSSSSIQDEESSNTSFYSNPLLDDTLALARRELDPAKRKSLYKRAEEIVRDDAPWAFVYGYRYYDVWQPYLHGYRPHPHHFQDLARSWFDVEQRNRARHARSAPPLSIHALALSLMRMRP